MRTLGLTPESREKNRLNLRRKLSAPLVAFIVMCLLPFVMLWAFHADMVSVPAPHGDIQAPVARVTTPGGLGTAFLVSSTHLITARHVVEGMNVGETVELTFEQTDPLVSTEATVEWMAPTEYPVAEDGTAPIEYFLSDVAVLKLTNPIEDISPLTLGISAEVENLDEVILIGYPRGDYSISEGNINNTNYQEQNLFKLDATSNSGNSGGPCILKEDNTVVGILVGGPSNAAIDGENIAMKIDEALDLINQDNVDLGI